MVKRGKLLIMEGLDRSGKSTCAKALVPWLNNQGLPAIYVKAPGQTPMGQVLRQMVINQEIDATEAVAHYQDQPATIPTPIGDQLAIELLHLADLRETATQVILPALEAGTHVICDRFHNSTRAYAAAHKVSASWIEMQIGLCIPEWLREQAVNLHFQLSVETFAERRQQYGVVDPLDAYDLSFYREVASVYHQLVENDRPTTIPEYWITVDAERSQEEVLTFVQSQILTSMWVSGLVTSTVYPA